MAKTTRLVARLLRLRASTDPNAATANDAPGMNRATLTSLPTAFDREDVHLKAPREVPGRDLEATDPPPRLEPTQCEAPIHERNHQPTTSATLPARTHRDPAEPIAVPAGGRGIGLAAHERAYLDGLRELDALGLDADLRVQAAESLRRKYVHQYGHEGLRLLYDKLGGQPRMGRQ